MRIAVDFDGTIVAHRFPNVGEDIGAFPWLRKFQELGAELILWTMRSHNPPSVNGPAYEGHREDVLQDAIDICKQNGIEFAAINEGIGDREWTKSPKAYAQLYIDDAAFGCPLVHLVADKPYVDWSVVGPAVVKMLEKRQ